MKKQKKKKPLKILVVGGGSGGHITPAVAVVRELWKKDPKLTVEFWTDRKYYKNVVKITTELGVRWGDDASISTKKSPYVRVRKIAAGKFHRYHWGSLAEWLRAWSVVLNEMILGNIVSAFSILVALWQSFWRMFWPSTRPKVVFLKGGYVGLPVGMVARFFKIPYVIHESDSVPGLANKVLMDKAMVIATGWDGMDAEGAGEEACVVQTGIPVAPEFKPVSEAKQKALKKEFGFDPEKPLVVFTGGSQGAQNINEALREILPDMLKFTSVGLVAGRKHYEEMVDLKKYEDWDKAKLISNFRMWEFNSAMHELLGAADVVVSRAGATTIAELAALKKAVVLVPYEKLPNSHQMRNAWDLADKEAVRVVEDARMNLDPTVLLEEVRHLVRAPKVRAELAEKLSEMAVDDAAERLATVLLEVAKGAEGLEEVTVEE